MPPFLSSRWFTRLQSIFGGETEVLPVALVQDLRANYSRDPSSQLMLLDVTVPAGAGVNGALQIGVASGYHVLLHEVWAADSFTFRFNGDDEIAALVATATFGWRDPALPFPGAGSAFGPAGVRQAIGGYGGTAVKLDPTFHLGSTTPGTPWCRIDGGTFCQLVDDTANQETQIGVLAELVKE